MQGNKVIAIGRQFGSRGIDIGKQLAEELGYEFYDKEILIHAAEQSGLHIDLLKRNDEKRTSSLLYTLAIGSHNLTSAVSGAENTIGTQLYIAQVNAIKSLAAKSNCVMVGRCADYFLEGLCDLTSVFITADDKYRIERIKRERGLSEKDAADLMKKTDRSRASFYNSTTGRKWGEAKYYDLCLSSSELGVDGAVKLIRTFLDYKLQKQ